MRNAFQREDEEDVHVRMMKKYKPIPQWWFLAVLISTLGLAIASCEGFDKVLQLPYWGVLIACFIGFVSTPPNTFIQATTSQTPGIWSLTEMIVGYTYQGKSFAASTFRFYAISTQMNAIIFLSNFKLGLYMKIPPRAMFICQIVGNLVTCCTDSLITWWILSSIENICHVELLPEGSPWSCTTNTQTYVSMVTWGVVGSSRMFYPNGFYAKIFLSFIVGAILPVIVWILSHLFPSYKWIKKINIPLVIVSAGSMPPLAAINRLSWYIVGFIVNYYVFTRFKGWWAKYTYLLSVGLDAGTTIMALLTTLFLNFHDIYGVSWWGLDTSDHCPLATCPTAPSIKVDGCLVF